MTLKKQGLLGIFTCLFLLLLVTSTSAKENAANFTWVIDESKYSLLEVHKSYEITGRLVRVTNLIKANYNLSFPSLCMNIFQNQNEKLDVFDYVARINNSIVREKGNINFQWIDDSQRAIANLPCVSLGGDDTLKVEYSIGGKIEGSHGEAFLPDNFFSLLKLQPMEERYYPFDTYNFSTWASLSDDFMVTQSAKVIVPPSFEFSEKSRFSCPILSKKRLYQRTKNLTDNSTTETDIVRLYFFTYIFSGYNASSAEQYLQPSYGGDANIVRVFGEIPCSPADTNLKAFVSGFQNLTKPFDEVRDWQTGNFLQVQFGRPELIKALFWFSISLQLLIGSVLIINNRSTKQRFEKIAVAGLSIWTFQEGLNILSPIVRPLVITLFDLTIFTTLLMLLAVLTLAIIKKILKKDVVMTPGYITDSPIKQVKLNLNKLPTFKRLLGEEFLKKLFRPEERTKKHPLFWLLLNDFYSAERLVKSLLILETKCDKFSSILDRFRVEGDRLNFFSLLTEIDILAHYYNNTSDALVIEAYPRVEDKGTKADMKIIANGEEYYVEILTVFQDRVQQEIEMLHDKIRSKLEEIKQNVFSLSFGTNEGFGHEHIEEFAIFVKNLLQDKESIKLGEPYEFRLDDKILAKVRFQKYPNITPGTVVGMHGPVTTFDDAGRLKSKILDKIRQLPNRKKNVLIINLSYITTGLEEIDEVIQGQNVVEIDTKAKAGRWSRLSNGIVHDPRSKNISLIIAYVKNNYIFKRLYLFPSSENQIGKEELTIFR